MDVKAAVEQVDRDGWVVHLHRWLAVLAWIAGGLLIFFVVRDYALTPLYYLFAPGHMQEFADAVVVSGSVLWWTLVTISVVIAVLLIICWPREARRGRRPLVMIGAGLVANWSWYLLDAWLDPWGIRSFTDATPELVQLANIDTILSQAITIVSAGLLITGAALTRRAGSKLEQSTT